MTRPLAPVHYLRPNEREYTPRSVIFADTETRPLVTGETDILGLRLWCARYLDRRAPKRGQAREARGFGHTGRQLADWISEVTRNRPSVWLFTHNLGFDLSTSRLPMQLTGTGWTVTDAAVGGKAPWIRMAKGHRRLTMVDSGSWLPMPLKEVGVKLGVRKLRLPADTDGEEAWRARCESDVDLLAHAMLQLMDWWDAEGLGNWSLSGPACGWNAYRHRPTTVPVVIDPEPAKVKRDRNFVHGGRRGTWRIGTFGHGPYWELDFVAAYPTIAAHLPHPIGRAYTFERISPDDPNLSSDRWGVTATVRLASDLARWPVRIDRATWYPVGRFHADLAGPDISEAIRLGAVEAIGPGEVHKLGLNMAPWGEWVLGVQHQSDPSRPPVAALAAKHWGRAVIGKWSQRGYVKERLGPAPNGGWGYEEAILSGTETAAGLVDLAGQRWLVHAGGDPDNAYPAVQAWVEAEVRARLGRVIAAIGEGAVIQCDTDGLIVDGRTIGTPAARGHLVAPAGVPAQARLNWVLDNIDPVTTPLQLRVKAKTSHVTVLGPQHLVTDHQRRFAGMSREALLGEDGKYRAKLWPSLQWQLANGDPRGYVRPTQTVTLRGPYPTGWILDDRTVVPVETTITRDGRTVIVPFRESRYGRAGLRLFPTQHPSLDALL